MPDRKIDKSDGSPMEPVVLVGTYRVTNADWIVARKCYNLPLPNDLDVTDEKQLAFHRRFTHVVLYAHDHVPIAQRVRFAQVVGQKELIESGYKLPKPPYKLRAERYALYEFVEKTAVSRLLVDPQAEVFVVSSRCSSGIKIDADFYAKPLPDVGGKSIPNVFEKLKPYFKRWHSAVAFNPVQLDFYCSMFASTCKIRPDEKTVISMFSGAMGLDNGIEQAGLKIRLCVEIQHAMAETIRANKPDIPLIEDDVRNYSGEELRSMAGLSKQDDVFLVCGGPPCQAFSTAGKRLGFDDDRGNVFLKYLDLIGEIRPKYFLLENVRGLLSAAYSSPDVVQDTKPAKGTALLYALEKIKRIGYSATFTLYDSANYGVPQRRERVIILGSRDGYRIPLIPPTHSSGGERGLAKWRTFREAIRGVRGCTVAPIPQRRIKFFRMLGPGQYWKDLPLNVQEEAMGKSYALPGGKTGFYRRLAWDEPSPTLVTCPTMPATDLMHPVEDRALSIQEYARIQMFPDNWVFKGRMADVYKQIGNAVPVGMGYAAARHLLWFDSLTEDQKQQVELIDTNAVYSRYRNTNFLYFENLKSKIECQEGK